MKKRTLLIIAALILVCAVSVGGTLAWLTDRTDDVVNTFTVGNVDIELTELTTDYKMVPGAAISKDPCVSVVSGSEDCWLFVKVAESVNLADFITYGIADGWTQGDGVAIPANVYYRPVLSTDAVKTFPVLATDTDNDGNAENDTVLVKSTVTKAMMDALTAAGATQPTLSFTAYACQKSGFETAADAWAAVGAGA